MYCPSCDDTLPPGARFCITCGHAIAATGRTERLGDAVIQEPVGAAGLAALCQRAFETGATERIIIAVHREDAAVVFELTEFIAFADWRLGFSMSSSWAPHDRPLGIYRAAEIWLKPWAVRGYVSMQQEPA